jgi:sensor histidine kinase YesM
MFKTIYKKHIYFFNLLSVLVLMELIRMVDSFAWMPTGSDLYKTNYVLFTYLFEFISFLPVIILMVFSYKWALKKKNTALLASLIILFLTLGPILEAFSITRYKLIFVKEYFVPFTIEGLEKYAPGCFVVILLFSLAFYLTHLKLQNDKQSEAVHKAETLAKEVQLKMLRYQINPHFLFNVLNSIHALIDENTEKAKKLVVEMSEYYRYTLNKQEQTITIEKEVESIEKYLEIQKIRFEEKFEYDISVDSEVNTVLIPSFIIHLLIENAVKYGMKTNSEKLIIKLSAKLDKNLILIRVANTGKLLNSNPFDYKNINGTSNGLDNIKNRLALFYKDNYQFSLKQENDWVVAAIEIKNIQS